MWMSLCNPHLGIVRCCWYAWLNQRWVPIPPDKIVPSHAPDGQAYLFMMDFASDIEGRPAFKIIVCFVRPKGGL